MYYRPKVLLLHTRSRAWSTPHRTATALSSGMAWHGMACDIRLLKGWCNTVCTLCDREQQSLKTQILSMSSFLFFSVQWMSNACFLFLFFFGPSECQCQCRLDILRFYSCLCFCYFIPFHSSQYTTARVRSISLSSQLCRFFLSDL